MSEKERPQKHWLLIAAVAVIAAAVPHAFFAPPLQLHMQGQMQAWIGIAVWAPAILAGVAFFFEVEFGAKNEGRHQSIEPSTRAVVIVLCVLAYLMLAASIHVDQWADMEAMRPWDELRVMLPMFAVLGALRALFFQGFVQDRVLADAPTAGRIGGVCAFEIVVVLPFLLVADPAVIFGLLALAIGEALLGAISHEVGYAVRVSMLLRAIAGAAFVWFQQMMLL